jgi:hypothetical protein
MSKINKILGEDANGQVRTMIVDYITEGGTEKMSLIKLDTLLSQLDNKPVKPIKKDEKNLITEK